MKDFSYPILDNLKNGLAKNFNKRNNPFLIESVGAFPQDEMLRALEVFTVIDISSITPIPQFPFPQLFVFSDCIIVCTATQIYEYANSTLALKRGGLPPGSTWDAVDFKTYIFLTNGKCAVIKRSNDMEYIVDTDNPYGLGVCNYNGQVLIGSPNTPVDSTFTSELRLASTPSATPVRGIVVRDVDISIDVSVDGSVT